MNCKIKLKHTKSNLVNLVETDNKYNLIFGLKQRIKHQFMYKTDNHWEILDQI